VDLLRRQRPEHLRHLPHTLHGLARLITLGDLASQEGFCRLLDSKSRSIPAFTSCIWRGVGRSA
jgi:hypothetical protein